MPNEWMESSANDEPTMAERARRLNRQLELIENDKVLLKDNPWGKENFKSAVIDEASRESHERGADVSSNNQKQCFRCKASLSKSPELISVDGQSHRWHPECFTCTICGEPMDKSESCHLFREQIVCKDDYIKLKRTHQNQPIVKCAKCRWPIGSSDWVRKAANFVYHLACFNCDICFLQLNTGDQFTLDNSYNSPHNSAVKLLCRYHFSINDGEKTNRATDHDQRRGHSTKQPMTASPTNESQNHSNRHQLSYTESSLFANTNAKKNQEQYFDRSSLSPNPSGTCDNSTTALANNNQHFQLLMIESNRSQNSGSHAGISSSSSLASGNYLRQQGASDSAQQRIPPSSASSSSNSSLSSSQPATNMQSSSSSSLILIQTASQNNSASTTSCMQSNSSATAKSKRVRTTFTDDQLSILQTHFQIDSNPDGQDLERIATITGLSKRVTQVWFQNSRARQKKYLVKKKPPTPSIQQTTTTSDLVHQMSSRNQLGGGLDARHIDHHLQASSQSSSSLMLIGDENTMIRMDSQSRDGDKYHHSRRAQDENLIVSDGDETTDSDDQMD